MIGDTVVECWNCGKSYDIEDHEVCPFCGEHRHDNPNLPRIPRSLIRSLIDVIDDEEEVEADIDDDLFCPDMDDEPPIEFR
jgi:hypothetical protein